MKKFKFQFEPVLTLREQAERLKQKEFASALQVLRRCRESIVETLKAMEETRSGMRAAERREVDMNVVLAHRRYLNHLEMRLSALGREHEALAGKTEEKRLELVEAAKKKKSLEKLREKRIADYNYEAAREEVKFFDEIGSVRFAIAGKRS
ncbi:MAG: flagellar export protein FliJ [Planctomycetota bacterium]